MHYSTSSPSGLWYTYRPVGLLTAEDQRFLMQFGFLPHLLQISRISAPNILCVALTILFAIETIQKVRAWRGENAPSTHIINTSKPHIDTTPRHYDTNIQLPKDQGPEIA
ncbi:unnamed protein product [Anisakis simplex]|uniref:Uncharacterized protein n=1 Tax=Anisakis simplex TaxID=6269 RepID=A0A0M3KIM9_ANISI|nr:unnamed protein product [Anisakis simplex]